MNILCTIHARKDSEGLKNKNIKLLNSRPLIVYTIDQAIKSKLFDKVVVSTDSKKIQKIAKKNSAYSWFLRQKKLSASSSGKIYAIRDTLIRSEIFFKKKFDIVVDLDVTSPLRKIKDIKNSFKSFIKNNFEILFSVCDAKKNPYFNMVEIVKKRIKLVKTANTIVKSRQEAPKVYELNASIYIWNRDVLLKKNTLITKKTGIYIMPVQRSLDIDNKFDFDIVSYLMRKSKMKDKF
jgi:CMP-N,N'-diacetyllegionaminic acid synthase